MDLAIIAMVSVAGAAVLVFLLKGKKPTYFFGEPKDYDFNNKKKPDATNTRP